MANRFAKLVTLDNSSVGASLTNFPALVSFTGDTDIGGTAKTNGADIRFYDINLNPLSFERDYHATTGGAASGAYHVKIPTLSASLTQLWIMWGDAAATDASSSTAPWDTNFKAVYHFGSPTVLSVADSLGVNNGTNHGVTAGTGKIGGAGTFVAASSQYVDCGNDASIQFDNNAPFTMSVWFNAASQTNPGRILSKLTSAPANGYELALDNDGSRVLAAYENSGGFSIAFGLPLSLSTWYALDATFDGTTATLYENGNLLGSTPASTGNSDTINLWISGIPYLHADFWDGLIDEIRLSSGVRSANFLKAQYNSSRGAMASLGSVTPVPIITGHTSRLLLGVG